FCEPGVIRSPNGKQIAMLLRENSRKFNSFVTFSNDEGKTWSTPRQLPASLTGDRHTGKYAPDGRLFITFRDTTRQSPTKGDWVGWVGTYDDIVDSKQGQYRVRLMDNKHRWDCAYPGLEILPDGTFVTTTYGHWEKDESPYIVSVRFKLEELDAKAKAATEHTTVFQENVDPYPHIRIPSIVKTNSGVLLAFAEGRQGGDHAKNDIILKRSVDDGKTWSQMQIVDERGNDCLNNPNAVVLPDTGRVILMYQKFPYLYHARAIGSKIKVAQPGITGDKTQKTFVTYSDDEGLTWSTPEDVTASVKRPEKIIAIATGPGIGIVISKGKHAGRIIMPQNETWYEGKTRKFNVYAVYSDDKGKIWQYGDPAPTGPGQTGYGNEVQMVELSDGSIMLNSRSFASTKHRKIAISKNGGETWSDLVDDLSLPEPQCMGSIIKYTNPDDGKNRLIFACPGTKNGRKQGTIRISYDDGKTWPISKTIVEGHYAYSCLTTLRDGNIGCLYEADSDKTIKFASFSLESLTGGKDSGTDKPIHSNIFMVGCDNIKGENDKDFAQYREQNIVITNSGRITVITQGRNKSGWSDRSGQDLVCKWSDDLGKTWSDSVLVVTHGELSVCPNAAVYDSDTNRIHVLYNLFMWP
ncbi:MAG: exo-alpha-sialidase, partial [Anaerohalosphaera sp.]|nr:exo-alpha-sialidase [Anaerohalosphaera sp.]